MGRKPEDAPPGEKATGVADVAPRGLDQLVEADAEGELVDAGTATWPLMQ